MAYKPTFGRGLELMRKLRRRSLIVLLCVLLLCYPRRAQADEFHEIDVAVITVIVVLSVAITVGVVLLVKHKPSVKGCAAQGPDGLQITGEDGMTYSLTGDVGNIKPGERVRVFGKKQKGSTATRAFIVEKAKIYGPCPAAATP